MTPIARFWIFVWLMSMDLSAHAAPVRILGASSLTESLTEITQEQDASLTFGGSGRIAAQVVSGAPADIVALAHPQWVDTLEAAGVVHESVSLLGNQLVLAARPGAPSTIQNLSTLSTAHRVAIGSASTPAGLYARESLRALGLEQELESKLVNTSSVRAVLAHIEAGTVDAGFIYRTDLYAAPSIEARFIVDPGLHTPIVLPFILTRTGSTKPEAVALFERITGAEGLSVFKRYGFTAVPTRHKTRAAQAPSSTEWTNDPVVLSIWVAFSSLLVSLTPALAIGWLMARREFRFKAALSTLCLAPLVLPPVVTGWLLLQCVSALSLPIAFTKWAAVLAAAVVGFPLLLILTRQAIESVDTRYIQLGETLGLTPFQAFYRVTLPMARPGIAAGCVLAFARALGEFGATAMVAGDQPGETRTLALAVYGLTEQPGGAEPAAVLVGISVLLTLAALLAYERLVWRQHRLTGEQR